MIGCADDDLTVLLPHLAGLRIERMACHRPSIRIHASPTAPTATRETLEYRPT